MNSGTAINPGPLGKLMPTYSDSEDRTDDETVTEQEEQTETEWYHSISPIETKAEYNKRTKIGPNDDF